MTSEARKRVPPTTAQVELARAKVAAAAGITGIDPAEDNDDLLLLVARGLVQMLTEQIEVLQRHQEHAP